MQVRWPQQTMMSQQKLVPPDRRSALISLDTKASLYLYRNLGRRLPRYFYKLLENSGSGLLWLPLVPAVWLAPGTPPVVRTGAGNLFLGLLVDLAFVGTMKAIVRRARPVYNQAGDFLLVAAVDRFSFPSGHAARATFLALFAAAWLAGSQPAVAAAVAAWGLLVAVSRCLMGRHFLGDILAGLAVGVLTTAVVTKGTFTSAEGWIPLHLSEQLHRDAVAQLPLLAQKKALPD